LTRRGWVPLLLLALASCRTKERHFESVCQLIRFDVLEAEGNKPTQVELELEWDPCPGDQFQVLRGGPEFAACMSRHRVGDMLSVGVVQKWDPHGFYTWDIERIAECRRDPDAGSEGSYEKSQECHEIKLQGVPYGFRCSKRPEKDLVKVCPWMKRD
jgi:hypothetical protein